MKNSVMLVGCQAAVSARVGELQGLELVGSCAGDVEALAQIPKVEPDIVLVDVRRSSQGGLKMAQQLKARFPQVALILIAEVDSELLLTEALRCGASGFLSDDFSSELLSNTIRCALSGGTVISSSLVGRVFEPGEEPRGEAEGASKPREPEPKQVELTPRELDVLMRLARGMTNKAIAGELHLAEVTVKKHVQSILEKMGVRDRTQAALRGVRLGLID